uniref:Uncharacterized protein n=1 Tax=Trypanosoma congolense (strain IL3000) TaxID=1068625 RepID=G0V0U1_TRYCI|nr:hypothetical protein, unlikely [Trypanosoma congolense IL3000]
MKEADAGELEMVAVSAAGSSKPPLWRAVAVQHFCGSSPRYENPACNTQLSCIRRLLQGNSCELELFPYEGICWVPNVTRGASAVLSELISLARSKRGTQVWDASGCTSMCVFNCS